MKFIVRAFAPTRNRRLNELVGLLLFASAILLFFALISYSPLDPSFNTAASLVSQPARNWIGVIGALISDLLLQLSGITIFLAPLMIGLLAWWQARARAKAQKELERKRTAKPFVTTQAFAARNRPADAVALSGERVKTGIERLAEEEAREAAASAAQSDADPELAALEVGKRADSGAKPKTTMPRIAGGYKLPSTFLLHRPDEQNVIDEDELKNLAQDLLSKCAEFDVMGQITHINPGPVVTTYE